MLHRPAGMFHADAPNGERWAQRPWDANKNAGKAELEEGVYNSDAQAFQNTANQCTKLCIPGSNEDLRKDAGQKIS